MNFPANGRENVSILWFINPTGGGSSGTSDFFGSALGVRMNNPSMVAVAKPIVKLKVTPRAPRPNRSRIMTAMNLTMRVVESHRMQYCIFWHP